MMSKDIKEDLPYFVEVKVKNQSDLYEMFLPKTENEHTVCDSIHSVVDDYNSVKVKKEHIDIDETNTEEVKLEYSYDNFQCKEEAHDEELSEILIKLETQNQQNVEEFSENSEPDEKIDITEIIVQSNEYKDKIFKLESENDSDNPKAFTTSKSPDDDPLKQGKQKTVKLKLKCGFCTELFIDKRSLDEHMLKKHKDNIKNNIKNFITSKIHACKICNSYESTRKSNLDHHINLTHNEVKNNMNCQFCNKSFARKWSLDDHIVKQHKQEIKGDLKSLITSKIYTCNICNSYDTTKKDDIDRHVNLVHNEVKSKIKCEFCTESFITQKSLGGHVLKKHRDKIKYDIKSFITSKFYACKLCNTFETMHRSSLNKHIKSLHNDDKVKIKCQFCTESFRLKSSLDEHVLRKHNDKIKDNVKSFITNKIHVCKICNAFETTRKWSLEQHVNLVHNKVKIKIKCQFCTESFMCKKSLDGHVLRKHNDKIKDNISSFITTKIYVCTICNSYETTHKSSLDQHVKSFHNKVKMKCQFCAETLIHKQSLDEHVLKKHKDKIKNDIKSFITSKIHVCKICNSYETTHKSSLDQHMNSFHNKVKIKCEFCTELLINKQSLNEHLLRKHRDKIKNDIKSFITNKIHICKLCNAFETTNKSSLDQHINSFHNKLKIKCQFCTESLIHKRSLDEHLLRKHKDKIENDIKSFITNKIHVCRICNYYESTHKSHLERHINSVHNKVKNKIKCQFCTQSFMKQKSLDGHVLKKHKKKSRVK